VVRTGELAPLFTDLYDADRNLVIEAKASVSREAIRMGLGQLLDYARFFSPRPELAQLLPERPREDLMTLLAEYKVTVIVPTAGDDFEELPG
jgi:hypothetical protein